MEITNKDANGGVDASLSVRNVAIIAHVDHGKTTLVDALLRQSGMFRDNESIPDRAMDSLELERERGITIASKNCSLIWENMLVNIVDTPGHADFGGEVERILSMVDGALVLVDAAEGPMPQTRFVVSKALEAGLKLVVIINKVDRSDQRSHEVVDEIFSLLIDCGADDEHLNSPVLFAIAREGKAARTLDEPLGDLRCVFEAIRDSIPPPPIEKDKPLSILVSNLGYSDYVGRLAIGRIKSGHITPCDDVLIVGENSSWKGRVTRLYGYRGLKTEELDSAIAGQIVQVAGLDEVFIGDTITDILNPMPQPRIKVEEPTVAMLFGVNSSPFSGLEGKFVTGRQLRERLWKESQRNVSIRVIAGDESDSFVVAGRGELQLSILIETMRREGYELEVSRPHVIEKIVDGVTLEPFEKLVMDIPEDKIGVVTELFANRRGQMTHMSGQGTGRVRIEYSIPSRGLIGIRSTFLTETRGLGLMHAVFDKYAPVTAGIAQRGVGALVSDRACTATGYAIQNLEARGTIFVAPGTEVYMGMIVGENQKGLDIDAYIGRPKKMSNMRSSGSDEAIQLTPPKIHTLESAMEWIADDELIEVTPSSIRLRKKILDPNKRPKIRTREEEDERP